MPRQDLHPRRDRCTAQQQPPRPRNPQGVGAEEEESHRTSASRRGAVGGEESGYQQLETLGNRDFFNQNQRAGTNQPEAVAL